MSDVASSDYDLIVGGSPIYTDEVLPSMTQFLPDNREVLSEKRIVPFFVYDRPLQPRVMLATKKINAIWQTIAGARCLSRQCNEAS
jgi:menaquinone-dependent protoporphyrinogen IX oxidase